ncbi:MAG: tRNA-dihydrouridine synthase [Patescibacteria group bacterium]|nr:tRNA-dihydrouridine synthase [Patescibacteria group bacterium]
MSFWNRLPKPFFVMAPMKDVTDAAFRQLVAKRGAPNVFWTEFVSADGLYHTREIKKMQAKSGEAGSPDAPVGGAFRDDENPLLGILAKSENEHPIVAQIFSSKPEMIAYAAKLVADLGFDGVDINMGCPDRAVEKQGAGAALVKNPKLAVRLIRAAQGASSLPVSVKTRIGYNKESLDEWLTALLEANPSAITLHLRTRKEMSLVPAAWEHMNKAVEIRNRVNPNVLLIGNGDVQDLDDARAKIAESSCEGAMLGRAMFGNPWVFAGKKSEDTPLAEKLAALVELAQDFEKLRPQKNFSILKKHIKAFVTGFDGAAELRAELMTAEDAAALAAIIAKHPVQA